MVYWLRKRSQEQGNGNHDALVKTQNWFLHRHNENVRHSFIEIRRLMSAICNIRFSKKIWAKSKYLRKRSSKLSYMVSSHAATAQKES